MLEFPQSVPNLTETSSNLYEFINGRNSVLYADDEVRLALSRCIALETARGWRIAKEKTSHKVDVIVALAQAALGAVRGGQIAVGMDAAFQGRAAQVFAAARRRRWSTPRCSIQEPSITAMTTSRRSPAGIPDGDVFP